MARLFGFTLNGFRLLLAVRGGGVGVFECDGPRIRLRLSDQVLGGRRNAVQGPTAPRRAKTDVGRGTVGPSPDGPTVPISTSTIKPASLTAFSWSSRSVSVTSPGLSSTSSSMVSRTAGSPCNAIRPFRSLANLLILFFVAEWAGLPAFLVLIW